MVIGELITQGSNAYNDYQTALAERSIQTIAGNAPPVTHAELHETSQRRQQAAVIEVGRGAGQIAIEQVYGNMTYGIARAKSHEDLPDDLSGPVADFLDWWEKLNAAESLLPD